MRLLTFVTISIVIVSVVYAHSSRRTGVIDLSAAVIYISPRADSVERKAAQMLSEEVEKRTGIRMEISSANSNERIPAINLGSATRLPSGVVNAVPPVNAHDGFRITTSALTARVNAIGNDSRGCLFAAGRLLRLLRLSRNRIQIPEVSLKTAPAKRLRGHQLGWRPKSNTYDRWGIREYEQYVRDLIIWGTNAIELIPLDPDGEPEASIDFNARLTEMIASYGLEVWLWYPFDDRIPAHIRGSRRKPGDTACPSEPDERKFILDRRSSLFKRVKRVDAIFIPGGDPGGCGCEKCRPWYKTLDLIAHETANLLRLSHPQAKVWMSNQGFNRAENEAFYAGLSGRTGWLNGIVFAPWSEESMTRMRERALSEIPIRDYPDITHIVRCQYPARDWDNAFALTLDREPPIYRIADSVRTARLSAASTMGAITYSDGVNDDLNKVVWSAILWDPTISSKEIGLEYARAHFEDSVRDTVSQIALGLEGNWKAPLKDNAQVQRSLKAVESIDARFGDAVNRNWRLQMMMLRGYFDAYVQQKLRIDTVSEDRALDALRKGLKVELNSGIRDALIALNNESTSDSLIRIRGRLMELGQRLYNSIGMQLSVPLWGASGDERGAILDHLDRPLANQEWLMAELARVQMIPESEHKQNEVERIVKWEDPGPGGFYDDLGNPARQPHLLRPLRWERDPGYLINPRTDFRIPLPGGRQSWNNYAEALYDSPVRMRYTGLDGNARYRLRAVYGGRYNPVVTLKADGIRVHGAVPSTGAPVVREWLIPQNATSDGDLTLQWDRVEGRGTQICEVWLLRETKEPQKHILTRPGLDATR